MDLVEVHGNVVVEVEKCIEGGDSTNERGVRFPRQARLARKGRGE